MKKKFMDNLQKFRIKMSKKDVDSEIVKHFFSSAGSSHASWFRPLQFKVGMETKLDQGLHSPSSSFLVELLSEFYIKMIR